MGDISIIARRLSREYVQYGWSGNGGYYRNTGNRLLLWYREPKAVDYLFDLGQTALIGNIGSERGGYSPIESHNLTGEPFWLGKSEQEIFNRIAFVDYGYFYDLDHKWYYVKPGPFTIKLPLELIANNLGASHFEHTYLEKVREKIALYIFNEYMENNPEFKDFLTENSYDVKEVLDTISEGGYGPLYNLYHKYYKIYEYFDDWILIKSNEDYRDIQEIILHKRSDAHIETNLW